MPKYKIAYGYNRDVYDEEIEADSQEEAEEEAYKMAKERFEWDAVYDAELITEENL